MVKVTGVLLTDGGKITVPLKGSRKASVSTRTWKLSENSSWTYTIMT